MVQAALPRPGLKQRHRTPPILRFLAKADFDGPVPAHAPQLGPCYVWRGAKNSDGYGCFRGEDRIVTLVHVFWYGDVGEGLELDHLCRNHACFRRSHLEEVTHAENVRRTITLNSLKTHCPAGHAYDAGNTQRWRTRRYCRSCQNQRREQRRTRARAA